MERRLAAILAADAVGYSRLMEDDEAGTLAHLEGLKAEILDPLVAEHRGRVIKQMGDGFLIEFASVVDAVNCALAWQNATETRADQVSEDRALRFRIGVNLGDVIVKDDDVFGEGVNLAARLEGFADPGAVVVSQTVADHVKGKVAGGFEDLGEQSLKNLAEPVRVFRVSTKANGPAPSRPPMPASRSTHRPIVAIAIALLLLSAVAAAWLRPWESKLEPASIGQMAFPLPDKPSIAVLPFNNMSNDLEQEYFADGITEDLITDLSKISDLFVIARNTVFTYKGRSVKVREVAEELGVRYVLEGSVRRAGDAIRINAQLIDATTGGHVWADRYDGSLADIFGFQDKVTGNVVAALAIELKPSDGGQPHTQGTANLDAYDAYLVGLRHLNASSQWRPEETKAALKAFQSATELDPNFAAAFAGLAWIRWLRADYGHDESEDKRQAVQLAKRSIEMSDNQLARRLLAREYLGVTAYNLGTGVRTEARQEKAVEELRSAVAIAPNDADTLADLALALVLNGNPEEAEKYIKAAKRLNPNFPNSYHIPAGVASYVLGNYSAAQTEFQAWFENEIIPRHSALWLSAAKAQLGDTENAARILKTALTGMWRNYTTASIEFYFRYHFPIKESAHREQVLIGLRKAGLPDPE